MTTGDVSEVIRSGIAEEGCPSGLKVLDGSNATVSEPSFYALAVFNLCALASCSL